MIDSGWLLALVALVWHAHWRDLAEAVNPHQSEHVPEGRDWACRGCRERFPCSAYRRLVWEANRGNRRRVKHIMSGWMEKARHEIFLSEPEYHARFIGWIRWWPGRRP